MRKREQTSGEFMPTGKTSDIWGFLSAFPLLSEGRRPLSTVHYAAFPHSEVLELLKGQAGPQALMDRCPNLPRTEPQDASGQLWLFC